MNAKIAFTKPINRATTIIKDKEKIYFNLDPRYALKPFKLGRGSIFEIAIDKDAKIILSEEGITAENIFKISARIVKANGPATEAFAFS